MAETRSTSDHHFAQSVRSVSFCTILSRIVGLLRDSWMAARFGNGPLLDAFTVAFRIPNLARALLGEGALATAFLPAYLAERDQHGPVAANRLAIATVLLLALILSGLVGCVEVVLLGISWTWELPGDTARLVWLLIYLMPYVALICLTAQFGALLNAEHRFVIVALLPAIMNLLWLVGLWWIVPLWSDPEAQLYVMAGCVLVSGTIQMLVPLPALSRLGFRYVADWPAALTQVRQMARQIAPVVAGLMVTQLNLLVDSFLAWGLAAPSSDSTVSPWLVLSQYPVESGTASALFLGHRLYQFPLGVFGVALGTVLFPLLARHAQARDYQRLRDDYALGLRYVAAVGIPASCGLWLISQPIAALFFQYGAFDDRDTVQTAQMIAYYGLAVWAHCGTLIIVRAFYALGDRLTPMRVGVITVAINVFCNLTLIWWLGGVALALSTSLAATVQCVLLGWLFEQKLGGERRHGVQQAIVKSLVASLAMYGVGSLALESLEFWPGWAGRVSRVVGPLLLAVLIYFLAAWCLRFREPFDILFRRREQTSDDQGEIESPTISS